MQGLRLGGHPVHPALVHFPVACWTLAPVLDLGYLLTHGPALWHAAFWCIALGVAVGLAAMCAGLMDLMALPAEHPAQPVAQRHLLLVGSAWCLFVVTLMFRPQQAEPSTLEAAGALALSASGFLLLGFGAYAGARLVYDFGIGQNRPPQP